MSLYVLDTDTLSQFQRGHQRIEARFKQIPSQQIAISIITAEEAVPGRFAKIRAARNEAELIYAYSWLNETLELLRDFQVLPYDTRASALYEKRRQQKLRIGAQDKRIAAIALSLNAIVVTSNAIHFGQIAGLSIEDWAK